MYTVKFLNLNIHPSSVQQNHNIHHTQHLFNTNNNIHHKIINLIISFNIHNSIKKTMEK